MVLTRSPFGALRRAVQNNEPPASTHLIKSLEEAVASLPGFPFFAIKKWP